MAQTNPVKWSASIEKVDDVTYQVVIDATINRTFHIYDMGPYNDVTPTNFTFEPSGGYELVGEIVPSVAPKVAFDEMFGHDVGTWEGRVRFVQKLRPRNNTDVKLSVEWMACNEESCIPPSEKSFTLEIKDFVAPVEIGRASCRERVCLSV